MADYREISQQYAQGGINASILINGGAAAALLSQYADLSEKGLDRLIAFTMAAWAFGVLFAAFVWFCGFRSTRYVDMSERATDNKLSEKYLVTSDKWMTIGGWVFVLSLGAFVIGAGILAWAVLSKTPCVQA